MRAWIKKHKIIVILLLAAICALLVKGIFFKDETAGYTEETAEKRDIVTYNSFVGNVEPASDFNLVAQASEEAVQVLVEKGDKVKAGQVIARLDTTNIDYNIRLQEATLKTTKKSNQYNISDAKRGYENYKETIDKGLNSSLESARMQMETAEKGVNDAQKEYDKAKASIEDGSYESIQSVYLQREQAYRAYDIARDAASDARAYYNDAWRAYRDAQNAADLTPAEDPAKASLESMAASLKTAMQSAEVQMNSAERSVDSAKGSYNDACKAFDNAKKNILDKLEDTIENAQISYDNTKKSFDVIQLQVNQQLESFEATLEKTEALSDVSVAEIQLASLKSTRKDYVITAPSSGIVTDLLIEKGDMVTMGMPIATIANLDTMQVSIKVDEYAIKNVSVGSPVKIYIDALEKDYEGTLIEVDRTATVEGGVSYFNAKVSFMPDEAVKSGMSVEVKLTRVDERDVVSLSQNSLQYHEDNTAYIYVKDENGKMVEKTLELGASDGIYVQITEGLSEGDKIFYPKKFIFNMEDMDSMREARNSMMLGE